MKNLVKVMSILLISVMVMFFATTVNAADDNNGFKELTLNTNTDSNTNTNSNLNIGNTNSNVNANNTNTNNTNVNKNTNNSSIYNNTNKNTDLPKTGIEDSIPVAMLVVVFGISAVYAYKKINDYKNI